MDEVNLPHFLKIYLAYFGVSDIKGILRIYIYKSMNQSINHCIEVNR